MKSVHEKKIEQQSALTIHFYYTFQYTTYQRKNSICTRQVLHVVCLYLLSPNTIKSTTIVDQLIDLTPLLVVFSFYYALGVLKVSFLRLTLLPLSSSIRRLTPLPIYPLTEISTIIPLAT